MLPSCRISVTVWVEQRWRSIKKGAIFVQRCTMSYIYIYAYMLFTFQMWGRFVEGVLLQSESLLSSFQLLCWNDNACNPLRWTFAYVCGLLVFHLSITCKKKKKIYHRISNQTLLSWVGLFCQTATFRQTFASCFILYFHWQPVKKKKRKKFVVTLSCSSAYVDTCSFFHELELGQMWTMMCFPNWKTGQFQVFQPVTIPALSV